MPAGCRAVKPVDGQRNVSVFGGTSTVHSLLPKQISVVH